MIEDDIRWSKTNKDYQKLDLECLNSFFSEMINYKITKNGLMVQLKGMKCLRIWKWMTDP